MSISTNQTQMARAFERAQQQATVHPVAVDDTLRDGAPSYTETPEAERNAIDDVSEIEVILACLGEQAKACRHLKSDIDNSSIVTPVAAATIGAIIGATAVWYFSQD